MLTVWLAFFVPWALCFNFVNPKIAVIRVNFGYCIFDTPSINCSFVPFLKGLRKVNISIILLDVLQMYELLLLLLLHPHRNSLDGFTCGYLEDNIGLHGKRLNHHSSKACSKTSEWKVGKIDGSSCSTKWLHAFLFFQFGHQTIEFDQTISAVTNKLLCLISDCYCKSKRVKQGLIHVTCI